MVEQRGDGVVRRLAGQCADAGKRQLGDLPADGEGILQPQTARPLARVAHPLEQAHVSADLAGDRRVRIQAGYGVDRLPRLGDVGEAARHRVVIRKGGLVGRRVDRADRAAQQVAAHACGRAEHAIDRAVDGDQRNIAARRGEKRFAAAAGGAHARRAAHIRHARHGRGLLAARRNAVNRNRHGRCGRIDRRAAQARGKGAHTGNRQRRAAERGHEARHGGAPFGFFICGE